VINHTVKLLATQIIRNNGATLPAPPADPIQTFLQRIEKDIQLMKWKRSSSTENEVSSNKKLTLADLQLWNAAQPRVSSLFLGDDR
jgi:hypothetical protein